MQTSRVITQHISFHHVEETCEILNASAHVHRCFEPGLLKQGHSFEFDDLTLDNHASIIRIARFSDFLKRVKDLPVIILQERSHH